MPNIKYQLLLKAAVFVLIAVGIVLALTHVLPRKGNVTTLYFNGTPVSLNDIRTACRNGPVDPSTTRVKITPTISINCGR